MSTHLEDRATLESDLSAKVYGAGQGRGQGVPTQTSGQPCPRLLKRKTRPTAVPPWASLFTWVLALTHELLYCTHARPLHLGVIKITHRCLSPKGWTLLADPCGSRVWVPKRCRNCTPCHQAHKAKTIARIVHGMADQNWFVFVTLTSTPDTTWPRMMTAFTRLVAHLRKTQPTLQYAAVKEEGSLSGMKHLHVIFHSWVWHDFADLQNTWFRLTGAYNVNMKRKPNEAVAAYAAKYVGKGNVDARKVATYSAKWPKLPRDTHWTPVYSRHVAPFPWEQEGEDSEGRIVAHVAETCNHVQSIHPLSEVTSQWLKSLRVPSWLPPPVPLAR
ncbi:hypothetical protein LCGC14_1770300 [marine sediment metagenome]|uniref:Replication-associated protein ORF2/G2P domain-containing protein n=1 Tax=marine sediment metagenome TaxID=412755 RepID=A0A0F9JY77_9ZZZZ